MKCNHKPLFEMTPINCIAAIICNVDVIKPSFDVILHKHPMVKNVQL